MDWVFTALPSLDPLARRNTGNVYLCVCERERRAYVCMWVIIMYICLVLLKQK
jgi:hypothetical protein